MVEKIGYKQVAATSAAVKTGPSCLFGVVCVAAGTVTIYDNTAASGTIAYTKTMAVGEVMNFGTVGMTLGNGLWCNAGTGTFNVLYT